MSNFCITQIFQIFTAGSNPGLTKNTRLEKFFNKFLKIKSGIKIILIICVPRAYSKPHINLFNLKKPQKNLLKI